MKKTLGAALLALCAVLLTGCPGRPEDRLPSVVTTITSDGPNPKTLTIQFRQLHDGKVNLNDKKTLLHYRNELQNAIKAIDEVEKTYGGEQ